MTNFKKMVAAITLTVMLSMSTVMADPGILVSDLNTTPTVPTTCDTKGNGADSGILISDLIGGIIILGRTGIIILGKSDTPADTTCK